MIKFEKVKRFQDVDFDLPQRKTAQSAGYDFVVAEDIVIPPYDHRMSDLINKVLFKSKYEKVFDYDNAISLDRLAEITKETKAKPTLVSSGVKCYLEPDTYLELSVRSSTPLKYWLMCANGVGIIDADYRDNPDNEGEIFFQLINFSPFPIYIKKGDIIGQGIIKSYLTTDDDIAAGERTGGFGSTSK